jgi:hypothetical protein
VLYPRRAPGEHEREPQRTETLRAHGHT